MIGARHENEPRAGYALRVHYEVLPQLVGPKLPGGVGVSGDEMPRGSLSGKHTPNAEHLRIMSHPE
jgi:hypothetical protein